MPNFSRRSRRSAVIHNIPVLDHTMVHDFTQMVNKTRVVEARDGGCSEGHDMDVLVVRSISNHHKIEVKGIFKAIQFTAGGCTLQSPVMQEFAVHCSRLHFEQDAIGQSAILQALGYSAMGAVANWGVKSRAQQHSQQRRRSNIYVHECFFVERKKLLLLGLIKKQNQSRC